MAYDLSLAALADPTRRKLFDRLRRRDHTVGELASLARISQPAVSQHLRVLNRARLVTCRREGPRRYYRASRDGLAELRQYIESMWTDVLAAFAADDPAPPKKRGGTTFPFRAGIRVHQAALPVTEPLKRGGVACTSAARPSARIKSSAKTFWPLSPRAMRSAARSRRGWSTARPKANGTRS